MRGAGMRIDTYYDLSTLLARVESSKPDDVF